MLTIKILQIGTPEDNYQAIPEFSSFVETDKQVKLLVKTAKSGRSNEEIYVLDNPGLSRGLIEEIKALTSEEATVTIITDAKQLEQGE